MRSFLLKYMLLISMLIPQIPVWAVSFASKAVPPALPQQTVQPTQLPGVTSQFGLMGYTNDVRPQKDENFKVVGSDFSPSITGGFSVYPKIDLVKFETDILADFAKGKGLFSGEKDPVEARGFIVLRYGIDNPEADDLFKWAKESGLHSVVVVTDGPISADATKATFANKTVKDKAGNEQIRQEDFTNDVRPEYLTNRGNGASLRRLLSEGYQMYSPVVPKVGEMIPQGSFFFAMSALANPKLDRVPIMHEKEAIMYILKDASKPVSRDNIKKIYVLHGSGNWTHVHINRNFVYSDDLKPENGQMGYFALDHAMATLETFTREGKSARIKDIPTVGRRKVTGLDGSFWESAYTDGQFELNQRIADELNVLAGDEETIKRLAGSDAAELARLTEYSRTTEIEGITLEHFVLTNGRVVDALVNLLKAKIAQGKPFPVTGVLDAQFVSLRTFGMGAVFAGYDVWTDFGKKLQGVGPEVQKWIHLSVQMEEVPGSKNINPDGAPIWRILAHGKTTMIKLLRGPNKERWTWLATGSYNNSNNYNNLERQDVQFIPTSSELAQAMEASVRTLVTDQMKDPKKALPLDKFVYLNAVAQFVGQANADVDLAAVEKMRVLIDGLHNTRGVQRAQALAQIKAIILSMSGSKTPSRLMPMFQVSDAQLSVRTDVMGRFFTWYLYQPTYKQGVNAQINANEMLGLALSILEKPLSAKRALRSVLWQPYATDEILEARAFKMYQAMGLEAIFFDKLKTLGLSEEDARKQAKFPWLETTIFNSGMISDRAIKASADAFVAGRLELIADILKKDLSGHSDSAPEKMDQLAANDVILSRLTGLRKMLIDYRGVPKDPNFRYSIVTFSDVQLVTQLFSENLDLVLLKEQPADRLRETVMYLYALKGYRDNRDKTPGPLTAMTERSLAILNGTAPATPVTPATPSSPAQPTTDGGGLRCARALAG